MNDGIIVADLSIDLFKNISDKPQLLLGITVIIHTV